jgi:hypothetical protein
MDQWARSRADYHIRDSIIAHSLDEIDEMAFGTTNDRTPYDMYDGKWHLEVLRIAKSLVYEVRGKIFISSNACQLHRRA